MAHDCPECYHACTCGGDCDDAMIELSEDRECRHECSPDTDDPGDSEEDSRR